MRQTCIYCRKEGQRQFDREHVIPEAFGKFKDNLILRCVCEECNLYFGGALELFLARDSGEALLRLLHNLKPAVRAGELRNTRIGIRIGAAGWWYGAHGRLAFDPERQKVGLEVLPQVALRKKPDGQWVWLTEDGLRTMKNPELYRKDAEIKIVGTSSESLQRLQSTLAELAIPFKQQGTVEQPVKPGEPIEAEVLYEIDQTILRGIGKIAFNYAAWAQGADFVLRADFDPFRRLVRFGEDPGWRPVLPSKRPILADDSNDWRQTSGHLIVLDWNRGNEGVVVQLSLFNQITYHALLCRKYSGVWFSLSGGHHFDIKSRTIAPITPMKLVRPAQYMPVNRHRQRSKR